MQLKSHSANLGLAGAWHGNISDSATGGMLGGEAIRSNQRAIWSPMMCLHVVVSSRKRASN